MRRGALLLVIAVTACAPKATSTALTPDPDAVRIYTSVYPNVIDAMRAEVAAQVAKAAPGVRVDWIQGGSERLRKRVDGELARGESPADLLLTSDPSHYRALDAAGKLVPYESTQAARIPAEAKDPEHAWVVARYSAMVLGAAAGRDKPKAFGDLTQGKKIGVSIGDPDFSGTNLVTVAQLSKKYGWDYYEKLKERNVVVAGSNGTVMDRLETGTTDVGIVLLENLLAARAKGSKVQVVVPADGAVVIPGLIALLPHAERARGAKAAYDAILSPEVQAILVEKGFLYSADPKLPPPEGAPKFEKLLGGAALASVFAPLEDPQATRDTFAKMFAREATAAASPSATATP